MQVFELYFKLLNHYKGIVIMYLSIFLGLALAMSAVLSADSGEDTFEAEKLDIAIIDRDGATLGDALKDYFGESNHLVDIEDDEDAILNELYWRQVDYVLIIPEGFEASLLSDDTEKMALQSIQVPGDFDADYFEAELDLYTSKLSALLSAGMSMSEAQQEIVKLRQKETQVTMASFVNENQNDRCTTFFVYVPYLFMALGIHGVGMILLRLNEKEVKARMECGALPVRNRIIGLTGAMLLYGLMLLLIVLLVVGILSGGSIYTDSRFPYFLLNMTAMLLLGLSLGFLTGTVAKSEAVVIGVVNVVSIAFCFLGGIFVPLEFFSEGVCKVARFVPTYWYVVTNTTIGAMKEVSSEFLRQVLSQTGLVACYALAIFAVTVLIISGRRKRRE